MLSDGSRAEATLSIPSTSAKAGKGNDPVAKHQSKIPRKRRTRAHVIADQSVNHIERYVIDEGHTVQRQHVDYGYDLSVVTYDQDGYVEPGLFYIQVKAAEELQEVGPNYVFDLDVRDYNLWTMELMPVVLILYDASRRKAFWLHIQDFFDREFARRPRKMAMTIRVSIPKRQAFNCRAVATLHGIMRRTLAQMKGGADYD